MIYKSYILEQNVNSINEKIALFYGVNLGLKNDLKAKIIEKNRNSEILRYSQDEILKDKALLENEIKNISLFEKNKIFFIENANDKILETIQEFENILSDRKIFLFSDVLDCCNSSILLISASVNSFFVSLLILSFKSNKFILF